MTGFVQSDLFQDASGELFTVAEARAYNNATLADDDVYPDADIIKKEAEIRQWLEDVCGVAFTPTTTTETLDGNRTRVLRVSRRNPAREVPRRALTVTAASIDGVALTANELTALKCHGDGRLVRTDGSLWSSGTHYQDLAVSVTYVHGWEAVPDLVKDAALKILVTELPGTNVPYAADSFNDGGMSVSFGRGDGFGGNWHRIPDVVKALRLYNENVGVVA